MEKQYIYILSNSKDAEIIKVGKTNEHPTTRAKQLSRQTGSVGKWQVEWYIVVPDADIAEKIAHSLFKEFREDPKKEFFKRTAFEASGIIEKKLVEFFEIEKPEIWESEMLKEMLKLQQLKSKLQTQSQELLKKLKKLKI